MIKQINKLLLTFFMTIVTLTTGVTILTYSNNGIQKTLNDKHKNRNDNISKFNFKPSIADGSESNQYVKYDFNYTEDKFWYWDQANFVKPTWRQTVQEVNPHWIIKPHGRWNKTRKVPPNPIINLSKDWDIPDTGPPNWYLMQPGGDQNTLDKSTWVSMSGKDKYYLDRVYESENFYWDWNWSSYGRWQYYVSPEWGYGWDRGYWPEMTQQKYLGRNKKVWVEYDLESHGNLLDSGELNINPTINSGPSKPYPPNIPIIPWYDKCQNKEPSWNPNKLNGEQHDVTPDTIYRDFYGSGNTSIEFDNSLLSPGFTYNFNYSLMYKDQFGTTKKYGNGSHSFFTTKNKPGLVIKKINHSVPNNGSVTIDVEVQDDQSTRVTPVSYELKEVVSGQVVDSGTFESNTFSKTYGNLELDKNYEFSAEFDYKMTYDQSITNTEIKTLGNIRGSPIDNDQIILDIKGNMFENIVIVEYFIDSTYHNAWKYFSNIYVRMNGNGLSFEKIIDPLTVKKGWNQLVIEDPRIRTLDNLTLQVEIESNNMNPTTKNKKIIIQKNPGIDIDYKIIMNNLTSTITSVNFDYSIENLTNSAMPKWQIVEYRKRKEEDKWSEWISLPLQSSGNIDESNLTPGTQYSFEMRATSPQEKQAFSNIYSVKTNNEAKITFLESTPTKDSYSMNFNVDNYIELVDKEFKWEIVNHSTNLIETGTYKINHNELHSINFDMLSPNTRYGIGTRYNDNGIEKSWSSQFTTLSDSIVPGAGYVIETDEGINRNNELIVRGVGDIRTIKISSDNKNYSSAKWSRGKDDLIYIDVSSILNIDDVVYVKVNNATVSKIRVMSDNTIGIAPSGRNKLLPIILISIFMIIGIGIVIGIGTFFHIRNNKQKHLTNKEKSSNMWFKAKEILKK